MIGTCPHCNTPLALEALTEDASARELFGLLSRLGVAGSPLVAYLGLFKPRLQALRWSRALMLAQQVVDGAGERGAEAQQLGAALVETVEAMRTKRQAPAWKPLTGHNYLWAVLESQAAAPVFHAPDGQPSQGGKQSRTAQTVEALRATKAPEDIPQWFASAIGEGIATLVANGVDGIPAYDMLPELAAQWIVELWPRRRWREDCRFRGHMRIKGAFRQIADGRQWPSQSDLLGHIPRV